MIVQNDVNHGLPSDNSNTSHTHLTRFYSRPSTIAPYFSLLLKANTQRHKRKQEQRNFQVSLLIRPCFDSSRQLLLTGCVWLVTTASVDKLVRDSSRQLCWQAVCDSSRQLLLTSCVWLVMQLKCEEQEKYVNEKLIQIQIHLTLAK